MKEFVIKNGAIIEGEGTFDQVVLDIQGSEGQLFSVTDNLTTGDLFAVSGISGVPILAVNVDGSVSVTTLQDSASTSFVVETGGVLAKTSSITTGGLWAEGSGVIYPKDIDNYVGIGTNNPIYPLEVQSANSNLARFMQGVDATLAARIQIGNISLAANTGVNPSQSILYGVSELAVGDGSWDSSYAIRIQPNSTAGYGTITTGAQMSYLRLGANGVHSLYLVDNGNVGIGTNSPQRLLHVHGSLDGYIHMTNDTTGSGSADGFTIGATGNVGMVWLRENSYIRIGTNGLDRMRIHAGGNVSIGNTTDTYKLDVSGTGYFQDDVLVGGYVGIGTTSPTFSLHTMGSATLANRFLYYTEAYTVNSASPQIVNWMENVSVLNKNYHYKMTVITSSTSTITGNVYLFWYTTSTDTWEVREISHLGTSGSNRSELTIDQTTDEVSAITYHASDYPVTVLVEATNKAYTYASPISDGVNFMWQRRGDNLFYLDGNVGIGTNNPLYTLDVAGSARVSSMTTGEDGDLVVTSLAGLLRTRTAAAIIAEAATLQAVTDAGNTTTNSVVINNDLIIAGGLYQYSAGVAGVIRLQDDTGWLTLTAGSGTATGANHTMYGDTHATLANTFRWRIGVTEKMLLDPSGLNISTNVDVAGTLKVSDDVTAQSKLTVTGITKLNDVLELYTSTILRRMDNIANHAFGSAIPVGTMVIQPNLASTAAMLKFKISGKSYNNSWDITFFAYLSVSAWSNVSELMVIGDAPFESNEIRLTFDSATGNHYILLGNTTTSWDNYMTVFIDVEESWGATRTALSGWTIEVTATEPDNTWSSNPSVSFFGGTTTIPTRLRIGNHQTSYALDVTGNSRITGDLFVQGAAGNINLTGGNVLEFTRDGINYIRAAGTGGDLIFQTGGSNNRMRINSSGLVGINRTDPAYNLDVAGNARVSSMTTGADGDLVVTSLSGLLRTRQAVDIIEDAILNVQRVDLGTTSTQALTTTAAEIPWDVENYRDTGAFTVSGNEVTVLNTGLYAIQVNTGWNANQTATRLTGFIKIRVNGVALDTTVDSRYNRGTSYTNNPTSNNTSITLTLNANDTVSVEIYKSTVESASTATLVPANCSLVILRTAVEAVTNIDNQTLTWGAIDNQLTISNGNTVTISDFQQPITTYNITSDGTLSMGSRIGQHINLYATTYGIGVQGSTFYSRTNANFAWYLGGVHDDGVYAPGTGGTELLRLSTTEFQYKGQDIYHEGNLPTYPTTPDLQAVTTVGNTTTEDIESDGNIQANSFTITNAAGVAKYRIIYNETEDSLDTERL